MSLKVGTIEELKPEPENKTGKPSRMRGGGNNGSSGKNRGGGGGGGDNRQPEDKFEEKDTFKPDKYRVGMGLILLVVLMTFGGLIGTYVVLATNQSLEWKPFNLPFQVWVSTGLIVLSSVDYELAKNSLIAGDQKKARKWFFITGILGAIFIASQILAWVNLVNQGYYAQGNPYAGLFYILTAVHAVHVVGGIISLGFIILKTQIVTDDAEELLKRQWFARVVGWYWHFIGVLWLVLFLLLGFYK
jgi:cytochrome c oxidase subunit III